MVLLWIGETLCETDESNTFDPSRVFRTARNEAAARRRMGAQLTAAKLTSTTGTTREIADRVSPWEVVQTDVGQVEGLFSLQSFVELRPQQEREAVETSSSGGSGVGAEDKKSMRHRKRERHVDDGVEDEEENRPRKKKEGGCDAVVRCSLEATCVALPAAASGDDEQGEECPPTRPPRFIVLNPYEQHAAEVLPDPAYVPYQLAATGSNVFSTRYAALFGTQRDFVVGDDTEPKKRKKDNARRKKTKRNGKDVDSHCAVAVGAPNNNGDEENDAQEGEQAPQVFWGSQLNPVQRTWYNLVASQMKQQRAPYRIAHRPSVMVEVERGWEAAVQAHLLQSREEGDHDGAAE